MRERTELLKEGGFTDKEKIFVLAFEGNETEQIYFKILKKCSRILKYLIMI